MAHKMALGFLLILILVCFLGPLFTEAGEYEIFYDDEGKKILSLRISAKHPLGTDKNGSDVFVTCSTVADFLLLVTATMLQTLSESRRDFAGYAKKSTIMRIVNIFNALPDIVVILILSALSSYGVGGREQ